PAHDLARPGLGQAGRELNDVGRGERPDLASHPALQIRLEDVRGLYAHLQGHIAVDALALDLVRIAYDRRLGDRLVGDQGALDLGGAQPVAGDVDDVVHAAGDPVVAVRIASRAVAGEVLAGIGREVGGEEALVVAVDRAHLARPAVGDAEVAAGRALQG